MTISWPEKALESPVTVHIGDDRWMVYGALYSKDGNVLCVPSVIEAPSPESEREGKNYYFIPEFDGATVTGEKELVVEDGYGERSATLSDLPTPVRAAMANVLEEIAKHLDLTVEPGAVSAIIGKGDITEKDVGLVPIQGAIVPLPEPNFLLDPETNEAWQLETLFLHDRPGLASGLFLSATHQKSGESFILKPAKEQGGEITNITIEQIEPLRDTLTLGDKRIDQKIPAEVVEAMVQGFEFLLGDTNITLSEPLRDKIAELHIVPRLASSLDAELKKWTDDLGRQGRGNHER